MTLYIILGVAGLVVIWAIVAYNSLIRLREQAREAASDIEVQTKRRFDLIPNLLETVKGYAGHEKNVLEEVTRARTQFMVARNPQEQVQADNMLTNTLKSLFAVSENYPDLKANQNFVELQKQLEDTENKIQAARRFYNANVRDLNIRIASFPTSIIAGIFRFQPITFFDAPDQETGPVNVKFL